MASNRPTGAIRIVLHGEPATVATQWAHGSTDTTRAASWRQWSDRALYGIAVASLWCAATWLVGQAEAWQTTLQPWIAGIGTVVCCWLCATTELVRLRLPAAVVGMAHGTALALALSI